ncbi:MAG: hypothetical protein ABL994_08530, partial [Verrucomicrobiales bacterium]
EYNGSRWLIPAGAAALVSAGFFYFAGPSPEAEKPGAPALAGSPSPASPLSESTSTPKENEAISIQLPRTNHRVPGTSASALSGVQGILPVGVRGTLREL